MKTQHIECWFGSFAIFQGIWTKIAKKPYIFVIFQGPAPSGSMHLLNAVKWVFYSFLASSELCCLLITFANKLAPDQVRHHKQEPDLDPNRLTL